MIALAFALLPVEPSETNRLGTLSVLGTLTSARVSSAPSLDGMDTDAVWGESTVLTITVSGGANTVGDVGVQLKSVYVGNTIYFVARWADAQDSKDRFPWYYDTTTQNWTQRGDQTSGNENTWYEDKMAMFWSIGDSVAGFDTSGCFVVCHSGLHYTNAVDAYVDMWHWKRVRNLGQLDDQYMDNNQTAAEGGRHSDPKTAGGYNNNVKTLSYADDPSNTTKVPAVWVPGATTGSDDSYWIKETDVGVRAYNITTVYRSNGTLIDEVGNVLENPDETTHLPGIRISTITGDRGNISAGWKWSGGFWTLEYSRPLTTGSMYDVQFDDTGAGARYYFGLSVFNNAQVQHNNHANVYSLAFEQPNQAPGTPTITASDTSVKVDEEIAFTVTATDPDGDTLTYAWNFGDGETANGTSATHAYDAADSYAVTVTASDGKGGTSQATVTIEVSEKAGGLSMVTIGIIVAIVVGLIAVAAYAMMRKKAPPSGDKSE